MLKAPRRYAGKGHQECAEHMGQGFGADRNRPGTLRHKLDDVAPTEVALPVSFYLLGRAG